MAPKKQTSNTGDGGTVAMRILTTLAHLHHQQQGVGGAPAATKKHVAALSGLRLNSSFRNACARLKKTGCIEYPSKAAIGITPKGLDEAGPIDEAAGALVPPNNDAIHDSIRDKYLAKNKKSRDIFDYLSDGGVYNKKEVAIAVGCPSYNSTFRNAMGTLKSKNIVEYPSPGSVWLTEEMCFPIGGRP